MPAIRPRLIQLTGCRSAGSGLSVRWARRLSVRLHRPQSDPEARRHSLSRDPSGGESYAALMACWSRYAHVCRRSLWALDRNAGETLRTQLAGVDTSSQIATACLRHPSVGSGVFDICSRVVRHHKIAIATMVCARGSEYRQVECVMTLKCFTSSKQELVRRSICPSLTGIQRCLHRNRRGAVIVSTPERRCAAPVPLKYVRVPVMYQRLSTPRSNDKARHKVGPGLG